MATQPHPRIPHTRWSKPRSCYRADGTPKRRYATREAAEHQARTIEEAHCVEMAAYECPYCSWWHCGKERRGASS